MGALQERGALKEQKGEGLEKRGGEECSKAAVTEKKRKLRVVTPSPQKGDINDRLDQLKELR